MPAFYALLVGINQYPDPIPPLIGCTNDVDAMAVYLQEQVAAAGMQLQLCLLKNEEATRERLIQIFQSHLGQAQAGDQVLFAYSGHGSRASAPPELSHWGSDRLNETLVCWDSRLADGWDLADKELAGLIAEVAAKGPQVTVILDCCHSGSGSRQMNIRYVVPDRRPRPLTSYHLGKHPSTYRSTPPPHPLTPSPPSFDSSQDKLPTPPLPGRHVLLAACRDVQTAKEYNAKERGVFSYFMHETLKQATGPLTYREVFKHTQALITAAQVPNQTPQLEAVEAADLDLPFLGFGKESPNAGAGEPEGYFTVAYNPTYGGWVMDAGSIHGIPTPTDQETTRLALLPSDRPLAALSLADAVGEATVLEVLPQLSRLEITEHPELPEATVYRAIATAMPLARRGVCFTGDEAGIELLRSQLAVAGPQAAPSLYVAAAADAETADLQVMALNGTYQITQMGSPAIVGEWAGFNAAIAHTVVTRLEHIARWLTVANLSSALTSQIPPHAIKLDILQADTVLDTDPIVLRYQYQAGRSRQPTFQLRLTNTSELPLYCALLDLTQRYAISPIGFEAGGVWLQPGETTWALGGKPLYASVPKELWLQGITEYQDIFKLIACTAEFDARLLAQGNLNAPQARAADPPLTGRPSTLNQFMRRIQTREISSEPEDDMVFDDWQTQQVTVVMVRSLEE